MDPSQRFTRKSFDQHRIIPYSHIDKAFIDEPKAKNLRLLPLTMNEILRLRLRMDNRDTSANFAMQAA